MCYIRSQYYVRCPPAHQTVGFASRCDLRKGLLGSHLSKSNCPELKTSTKMVADTCPSCTRRRALRLAEPERNPAETHTQHRTPRRHESAKASSESFSQQQTSPRRRYDPYRVRGSSTMTAGARPPSHLWSPSHLQSLSHPWREPRTAQGVFTTRRNPGSSASGDALVSMPTPTIIVSSFDNPDILADEAGNRDVGVGRGRTHHRLHRRPHPQDQAHLQVPKWVSPRLSPSPPVERRRLPSRSRQVLPYRPDCRLERSQNKENTAARVGTPITVGNRWTRGEGPRTGDDVSHLVRSPGKPRRDSLFLPRGSHPQPLGSFFVGALAHLARQ